jgi:hypothetical protein
MRIKSNILRYLIGIALGSFAPLLYAGISISSAGGGGISFGGISGGTATRVLFTGGAGTLTDDADLTFSTDTLTATKFITTQIGTTGAISLLGNPFTVKGGTLADKDEIIFGTQDATTAVLTISNLDQAKPIFIAKDNVTTVFTIADGGAMTLATNTVTCSGSTCALTIGSGANFVASPTAFNTTQNNAATNTFVASQSTHQFNSLGAAATGFGWGSTYSLESSSSNGQTALAVGARWLDATHAQRTGEFLVQTVNNANALADTLTVGPGHLGISGGAPTFSSCGTSPTIAGSDTAGKVTAGGGGAVTSCVFTFARQYLTAPACIANNETTAQDMQAISTTTTLTLNGADFQSDVISYLCVGR